MVTSAAAVGHCKVCGVELDSAGPGRPRKYCTKHAEDSHRESKYRSWVRASISADREVFVREEDRGAYIDGLLALCDALNELERRVPARSRQQLTTEQHRALFDAVWGAVRQVGEAAGMSPAAISKSGARRLLRHADL